MCEFENIKNNTPFYVHLKKKKHLQNLCKRFIFLWASLGLNQGPPDYESVALTN